MGYTSTTPKVIEFLQSRRGEDVTIGQLVAGTGLTHSQVRSSMRILADNPALAIEVLVIGQMWRLCHNLEKLPGGGRVRLSRTVAIDASYSALGKTAAGETIVKGDTSGKLYKVVEL